MTLLRVIVFGTKWSTGKQNRIKITKYENWKDVQKSGSLSLQAGLRSGTL